MDKRRRGKITYYLLLTFFAAVFLASSVYLAIYFIHSRQNRDIYDNLASQLASQMATLPSATRPPLTTLPTEIPSSGAPTEIPDPTIVTDPVIVTDPSVSQPTDSTQAPTSEPTQPPTEPPTVPTLPGMLPHTGFYYQYNQDTVGLISIPGAHQNYPVMQTPAKPDYYLTRNFYHVFSDWGAIYAREACNVETPSDNVVLYGHHMRDGSMFACLDNYKREYFWRNNQYIQFDTLYEYHTYQVFAVFRIDVATDDFAYHMFNDAPSADAFDAYISIVRSRAMYDTDIIPQYGDKLLTLSTCEYSSDNGRLVVMAVRIA